MKKNPFIINIIANGVWGPEGLSGSDRIFIESARRWAKWGYKVNIFGWEDTLEICKRNNLKGVDYVLWPAKKYQKFGFTVIYIARTIRGCLQALKMSPSFTQTIIYSASDFWPDILPGFIMSRKLKNTKWVGSLYLFAPNPCKGFSGKVEFWPPIIKNYFYYFSQKPIIFLLKKFADLIFVTYDLDKKRLITGGVCPKRVKVVYGGVDLAIPKMVKNPDKKRYDGVFVGRFHPQKGLLDLIKTWHNVCKVKSNARLALIGLGDPKQEKELLESIKRHKLSSQVELLGTLDGREKYEVLKSSMVYLCPSLYDSGGMATIEAMAAGLPVVSFDIAAVRSLIPKGTLRVPFKDTKKFAEAVLELLNDQKLYKNISSAAIDLANEWDWDLRAKRILDFMETSFNPANNLN